MSVSPELQRIYASAPVDITYIETLTVSHSLFTQTYYLTNDVHEWHFRTVVGDDNSARDFIPMPFEIKLPKQNSGGLQELDIVLCNVGLELLRELDFAIVNPREAISAQYQVYLNRPLSDPQMLPPLQLFINEVSLDESVVTATATRFDVLNKTFPTELYNTEMFPGLLR